MEASTSADPTSRRPNNEKTPGHPVFQGDRGFQNSDDTHSRMSSLRFQMTIRGIP